MPYCWPQIEKPWPSWEMPPSFHDWPREKLPLQDAAVAWLIQFDILWHYSSSVAWEGLVQDHHKRSLQPLGVWNGVIQARQVEGLKWYYHCRPSLAMIVDLSVLPGLCFQSLATFYCRFHCRPLNQFVLSVSHQTRRLWPFFVEHKQKGWNEL